MDVSPIFIVTGLSGGIVSIILILIIAAYKKADKEHKNCITQIIKMLREYNVEHIQYTDMAVYESNENVNSQEIIDEITYTMCNTFFNKILKNVPKEDRENYIKQYCKDNEYYELY